MPTLEQKQDGDYIIRAYMHTSKSYVTWQVMPSGVALLYQHGVHAGQIFPQVLLQKLIDGHFVFTGGSGTQAQKEVSMPTYLPPKTTPPPKILIEPKIVVPSMKIKISGKDVELLITFPEFPQAWLQGQSKTRASTLLEDCKFSVMGTTSQLQANQLLPGNGMVSIAVPPQVKD